MKKAVRVLLIEDSEDDALSPVRELQRGGYEPVYERVDTPSALQAALQQIRWGIIISDYALSQFSALSALELVKENELDLPFIIVSGKTGEDTAEAATKAGAHDYIVKYDLALLIPSMERGLKEAEMRRFRRSEKNVAAERPHVTDLILKHARECILLLDRDFNVVRVSDSFARDCRRDISALHGRNLFELYPSDTRKHFDEVVRTQKGFQSVAEPFVLRDDPELEGTYWDRTLMPVLDEEGEVNLLVRAGVSRKVSP